MPYAGVVKPPVEPPLSNPALLLGASIQVSINGTTVGVADGRALPEGPFGSVVRLAEHLARFGRFLQQGQIVLTGSPLPLYRVTDGERIEVSSEVSGTVVGFISRGEGYRSA
jgi:2-keto-4-pentenoate hydratase